MIRYGLQARVEYDGWWHVFIAREPFWPLFWKDIYESAHPPLYFLLLKLASALGTEPIVYRSISIVAAGVAVVAVGLAIWRVSRVPTSSVLCALGFGLATPTAVIANEVRSYMVATALLLLALLPYLTLIRPGGDARARVLFSTFVTLSLLSHYGVVFVVLAMAAAPFVLSLLFPSYRRAWSSALSARWRGDLATLAPPALVLAAAYTGQMARYREPMAHLPDFYYSGGEPLSRFLARNLLRQIDLFSPIELASRSTPMQTLGVAVVVAVPVLLIWLVRRQGEDVRTSVFPVILLTLTAAQMAASIRGDYPFGGGLRHQFFIFPFAAATLFLFLDRLWVSLPTVLPRQWVAGVLGASVLANAHIQWRHLDRPTMPLFQREFDAFRTAVPDPEVIYLDGFSLFAFFGHVQDLSWTFQGHSAGGDLQIWHVEGENKGSWVFRDMKRWNPPPDDPEVYRALHAGLATVGASSASVFRIAPALEGSRDALSPDARIGEGDAIARVARTHGLTLRRIVAGGSSRFLDLSTVKSVEDLTATPEIINYLVVGIRAEPNPIRVCPGEMVGAATLSWYFPGKYVEIRIDAPDGKLWTSSFSEGAETTGSWVDDGMAFFVQDSRSSAPTSPESTLGTVVVRHIDAGCPGSRNLPGAHALPRQSQ